MTKHRNETVRALALGILVPAIAAAIAVVAVLASGW